MTPFIVNQKSLHYRLASVYGPLSKYRSGTDICSYTRAVLLGIAMTIILTAVGGLFASCVGIAFSWIAAMVVVGGWIEPHGPELIGLLVVGVVTALFVMIKYDRQIVTFCRETFTRKDDQPKTPGFVVQAYRSFKEKYCIPVEIMHE